MSSIKQNLKNLYETMLDIQSMNLEQFRTSMAEQDPKFQGIALILNEGLYAFENLNFEEESPVSEIETLSSTQSSAPTTENTNDNQQTQSNQNTVSTGTSGY